MDWQPMETAPKGQPTENIGCRSVSEWFEARVAVWIGTGRREWLTIRRRAWPQEDSWEDKDNTYYASNYFDGWRPRAARGAFISE